MLPPLPSTLTLQAQCKAVPVHTSKTYKGSAGTGPVILNDGTNRGG